MDTGGGHLNQILLEYNNSFSLATSPLISSSISNCACYNFLRVSILSTEQDGDLYIDLYTSRTAPTPIATFTFPFSAQPTIHFTSVPVESHFAQVRIVLDDLPTSLATFSVLAVLSQS